MSAFPERIRANLAAVRERMARAAERAGRDPAGVKLLVVTKSASAEEVAALPACGVGEAGESRVQDAQAKARALGAAAGALRWQLIGHLQTNKARKALEVFSGMHSLDSARLAAALEKELAARRPDAAFPVYIEVNTTGEDAKTGASGEELRAILEKLRQCPHLDPVGLMTMGPLGGGPEAARKCFRRLRETLAELRAAGQVPAGCSGLSMGMSGDFEAAIEEGATVVRVGSAIFAAEGPR